MQACVQSTPSLFARASTLVASEKTLMALCSAFSLSSLTLRLEVKGGGARGTQRPTSFHKIHLFKIQKSGNMAKIRELPFFGFRSSFQREGCKNLIRFLTEPKGRYEAFKGPLRAL
jgi:hypothetical protein